MSACDGEVLVEDIHRELRDLAAQVASNSIPVEKFVISKVIENQSSVDRLFMQFLLELDQRSQGLQ